MKSVSSATAAVLALVVGGAACATVPVPAELASARTVYDRSAAGPAASLDPADLHTAHESLEKAEQSFTSDGDTQKTRDLAYTAQRGAEVAETRARTMQFVAQKEAVTAQMLATQTSQVTVTAAQLGMAKQQLATQGQALAGETARREDADKRAAQAAADLARFATVKQEPRGMVITLSGSVLFTSANWALLPEAQSKLSDVAAALEKQSPTSKISVEGYTDSQGGASYNLTLSQKRADSVRTYLVSHGIASDRVTAQGMGLASPIADNASPEGRANNRRVEIVVQPSTP